MRKASVRAFHIIRKTSKEEETIMMHSTLNANMSGFASFDCQEPASTSVNKKTPIAQVVDSNVNVLACPCHPYLAFEFISETSLTAPQALCFLIKSSIKFSFNHALDLMNP